MPKYQIFEEDGKYSILFFDAGSTQMGVAMAHGRPDVRFAGYARQAQEITLYGASVSLRGPGPVGEELECPVQDGTVFHTLFVEKDGKPYLVLAHSDSVAVLEKLVGQYEYRFGKGLIKTAAGVARRVEIPEFYAVSVQTVAPVGMELLDARTFWELL